MQLTRKLSHYISGEVQRGDQGIAPTPSQSGVRRKWVVSTRLRPLYSRKRPYIYGTGGWVGGRAGLY